MGAALLPGRPEAPELVARRATFLAEAGALLDASLDYQETLRTLATLLVPALGRYCLIDVLEDGVLRHAMAEHADPQRGALVRRLLDYPRDLASAAAIRPGLLTGRATLTPMVTAEQLARAATDAEHLALLTALEPTSCIDVPLVARGATIGAIVLATDARGARRFGPADVEVVEALAHRAALSLDNARLYRAARRATQLRDEMLGIVSHDLRTPLTVISMSLRALEHPEEIGTEDRVLAARTIRESLEWLQHMLQDLLDIGSIEAGRLRMEPRRQDPLVTLMRAAELMEPLAGEAGLELGVDVPEHLPAVDCDEERILQVLANLVGNAVKFTPPGGRVTLRAEATADELVVSIADTGPGIPPADLSHVFERFWHARRAASPRGTGLGLPIAKGIVDAHGGRIWAESIPGRGSTFRFSLPRAGGGQG